MLALKLLISILYYSLLYVQSYPENWDLFSSLVAVSDENGRKNLLSTSVSIFFWRKRDRVRKIRVRKWDRVTRKYGNEPIRTLSRKE